MNDRVEIPAYTDDWMRGDRYGEVVKVEVHYPGDPARRTESLRVKLDKSGKERSFVRDDCTVLS